ncbi:odorant receptor 46a-like [Pararge aegeria]|uniref:odorant receptor 46a-like n=1 Tax=Pararge aegeria TaxID=116150 RepID=UPI0019D2EC54|nr:odorant receptor 46a-like [Pararge aegeria]
MFETFEAFQPHFNALARFGYYKIVTKPVTKFQYKLHYYYRIIVWIGVVTYNIQLIISSIQTLNCTEQLLGTLFILLTTLNTLGKHIAFNLRVRRIDNLIGVLKGPSFACQNSFHENIARTNAVSMARLLKLYHIAVTICGVLFTVYPLINQFLGQEGHVPGYFPFDTSEAPIFHLVVLYMGVLISLQGFGHVTMDCTIVGFYAQAKTQLQIFRYNFEHFVDEFESDGTTTGRFEFIDENENHKRALQRKFVSCLDHYEGIVRFAKEVESIFGEAMIVQFFVMVWVICMTTYKIAGLSIMSAEFVSIVMYLGCMLAQLFIYCYYGTHLKVESEQLNNSIYQSGWQSLSPSFRRHLYMLMERCKRSVEPRTAYIIPMSLDTYISKTRAATPLTHGLRQTIQESASSVLRTSGFRAQEARAARATASMNRKFDAPALSALRSGAVPLSTTRSMKSTVTVSWRNFSGSRLFAHFVRNFYGGLASKATDVSCVRPLFTSGATASYLANVRALQPIQTRLCI